MADDPRSASLGAPRKCATPNCDHPPVEARLAATKNQIDLSTGRIATVEYACTCGWTRWMPLPKEQP